MRKRSAVGGLLVVSLVMGTGALSPAWTQLSNAPWPKFQHDLQNTGRSPLPGPATMTNVKWTYSGTSWIKPQVAVSHDNAVYLSHSREVVVRVNATTGAEEWTTGLGGYANQSSPAIGNGSTTTALDYKIYRGERNNKFWSFESDGTKSAPDRVPTPFNQPDWDQPGWPYKIKYDGDVFSSPAITPDGTIYTACGCLSAGLLHAFLADGTQKWPALKIGSSGIRNSSPAVIVESGKNVVFIGSSDGYISRVDDDGTAPVVVWRQKQGSNMHNSSPSIAGTTLANGKVYIGSSRGIARYDAATGARLWYVLLDAGKFDTTAAVGAPLGDGTRNIYVSAFKNRVRTVYRIHDNNTATPTTTVLFSGAATATNGFAQSPSPIIDSAGNVYAGVGSAVLRFNGTTGAVTGQFNADAPVISIALGNGVLYVNDRSNKLYAIGN